MKETCENCAYAKATTSLFCRLRGGITQSGSFCLDWEGQKKQTMQDKLEQIADGYEFTHQSIKLFEEMGELQQALAKVLLDNGPMSEYESSLANLEEELADVQIMLLQIKYLLDISDEDFEQIMEGKIDRTLKRMEGDGGDS